MTKIAIGRFFREVFSRNVASGPMFSARKFGEE